MKSYVNLREIKEAGAEEGKKTVKEFTEEEAGTSNS